ncbi:hypothetical protein OEZ86_003971 [Tetradesmus obliquus]|nr:hypothetical protein OEZ86_003971 [Tetradesmus obliquus]
MQAAAAATWARHVPFASPISPPPLKPYVLLASPAAAGRRSSIAPSAGGVMPSAAAAAGGAVTARRPGGRAGTGPRPQPGCMTAPAKAPSSRTFARQRQQLSQQLYDQWNAQVFDGALPAVPLVWNPRLTATAGQVVDDGSLNRLKASRQERIPVRLELSTKVLDCEARLRTTLAHEMCHVAAWAASKEYAQHHGPAFWAWARRVEARLPGIKVTTCHSYEVHAPFRWQCANNSCGKQYHRHKRSIDPAKHVCSRCSGRLLYLGKFSRDGKLVGSAAAGAATPGATPGGNAFSQFVKSHFAQTKRELPAGTPHKELMSRLAADYKQHKESVQKQQQQQQQQASPQAAQQLELQPVCQQQQQLDEGLVGQSQLEVVELSDSEDEAGSGSRQQQQPQHDGQERLTDQEEMGGLLSFLQRLDLASTE